MPRFSVFVPLLLSIATTAQTPSASAPDTSLPLAGREATVLRKVIGFTRESRRLVVSAETTGRLLEVLVEEGAIVPRAGDADPASRGESVVARVDCARQRLQLDAERAALALAREDAEYFERERQRVMKLDRGLTTDESRLAKTHGAEVARLVAEAAEVSVALAADQAARCEVRAPAGLEVLRRLAEPGELMQPGRAILELADFGALEVDLRLSEDEIRALREQESPVVRVLDRPELTNGHGTVAVRSFEVFPEFDPVALKRRVELRLSGSDMPEASGGLRVELALRVVDAVGAWLVPASYLIERTGDVLLLTTQGSLQVTILRREGDDVVVLGRGLSARTTLLLPGGESVERKGDSGGDR